MGLDMIWLIAVHIVLCENLPTEVCLARKSKECKKTLISYPTNHFLVFKDNYFQETTQFLKIIYKGGYKTLRWILLKS